MPRATPLGLTVRRFPLGPLAVALAALVVYAGTLAFDFVWDDTLLIQRSYQLHHWRDLWPALTSHFWAELQDSSHYYRPLVTLSFFLDLKLWGLNPLGFHLTNVLAHLATSLAGRAYGTWKSRMDPSRSSVIRPRRSSA